MKDREWMRERLFCQMLVIGWKGVRSLFVSVPMFLYRCITVRHNVWEHKCKAPFCVVCMWVSTKNEVCIRHAKTQPVCMNVSVWKIPACVCSLCERSLEIILSHNVQSDYRVLQLYRQPEHTNTMQHKPLCYHNTEPSPAHTLLTLLLKVQYSTIFKHLMKIYYSRVAMKHVSLIIHHLTVFLCLQLHGFETTTNH